MQAQRPVLCIGPSHGDAADIIRTCAAGSIVDFGDTGLMKQVLVEKYQSFCNNSNACNSKGIDEYSYSELTKKVVNLLNNVIHD